MIRNVALTSIISLILLGCASTQPAPVIDRAPGKPVAKTTAKPSTPQKDWRPDSYTVKKGDTLYSIGLQYGYDYKEIASANNITAPYTIVPGQQLRLKEGKLPENKNVVPDQSYKDGDVVIAPLKMDSVSPTQTATSEPPVLSEPKALREPYSEQALATKTPTTKTIVAGKPVESIAKLDTAKQPDVAKPIDQPKPADTTKQADNAKPAVKPESTKTDSKSNDDESIDWVWPTAGKVITSFNEDNSAKGIDIAGTAGQPITAAAPGKVIYSGSELRGYGKLVIIKHNKTYLSVYAHNSQIAVKEGQTVNAGQKIAEMGNTDADRVKLHFEIRQQGKSIDPAKYLPSNQ